MVLLLLWLLLPEPSLKFILPVRDFMLAGPKAIWFEAQAYIPRDPANRWVALSWDGIGCHGSGEKSLEGEDEAAIFPLKPLKIEASEGVCSLRVTLFGAGGKVLKSVTKDITVCGSEGCE